MAPPDGREEVFGDSDAPVAIRLPTSTGSRIVEWLTRYGERIGNGLVYSSAYLAIIAMVEVAIVMVLFSLRASPAPLVGGLVTFAVYVNDHLKDDPTSSPRARFVDQYRDELYLLASIAYGLGIMVSVLGGPIALVITVLPGLFWIVYASGRIPGLGFQLRRLKQTLVINTSTVALAWAISVTFLPLAFADRPISAMVLVVFGYFFLRSFVDTVIPNVRDVEADRAAGVRTIPGTFGVRRTKHVLYGLDGVTLGLIGLGVIGGVLSPVVSVALGVGIAYSMVVTSTLGRIDDHELLATAAEFEYVVVGLALVPVVYGF